MWRPCLVILDQWILNAAGINVGENSYATPFTYGTGMCYDDWPWLSVSVVTCAWSTVDQTLFSYKDT